MLKYDGLWQFDLQKTYRTTCYLSVLVNDCENKLTIDSVVVSICDIKMFCIE